MESNLIQLNTFFLIGMPGGSEWILIIFAVLLLFGGKKIPELMRGVGKGIREFKDAREGVKSELDMRLDKENKK
jgi:sec-independent protein translocase protein TatA